MIGLSAVGLVGSFLMKELVMHGVTDERFGFEDKEKVEGEEGFRSRKLKLNTWDRS
jgi:hypothetical protein